MTIQVRNLVNNVYPPRSFVINQGLLNQHLICVIMIIILPLSTKASVPCSGRFVNPISDVCWSCLLPISIGPLRIGGGTKQAGYV